MIDNAARPVIEQLENRRLLSATLTVSNSLMVFNAVENSSASPTETLTLTNTGNAPLTLGSGAFALQSESGGTDPFSELNAGSAPVSLAPGASFGLQLNYAATAVRTDAMLLDITTNDPVNPVTQVSLHGIGTKGLGGSNQPSLATILQAYDIPTLVGEGPNDANAATDSTYPYPPDASSQEVVLQRLVKAGAGPVTINVLASFTAAGTKPYVLGTYTPGNPSAADLNELFYTPTSESQSVYVQPQGATSFDPGSSEFGFYCVSNVQVKGRLIYTEDSLNTFDSTTGRHFRFFPMENPDGSVVPNTYIMTSTEWNGPSGYDFTNVVAIVSNIMAAPNAPGAPVMGLQNLNAVPGSNVMVFNRIQNQNTSVGDTVHDTGTLQVNNTGDAPLILSSYTLSSGWELLNAPTFPVTVAAGKSLDLSIKFIATTIPTESFNWTNGGSWTQGGADYGTLTLNGNDPNTPTQSVSLAGYWQYHSENENEPNLMTIVNRLFDWGTYINSTPTPFLTESSAANSTPTYYGEEVVSAYWQEADPSVGVTVEQIAAYHTQGNTATTYYYPQGSPGSSVKLWTTGTDVGQTLFPTASGASNPQQPAEATFTSTGTFGFRVDSEYSDNTLNSIKTGGGHHFRFYPIRDAEDNLIPNTYIMTMDYGNSPQNFDFQDNVWIVSNIRPAIVNKGISVPQTTGAPAAPTDLYVTSTSNVNTLQWAPIFDSSLVGYDVYRSSSSGGTFTLLTKTPIAATTYVDSTPPTTGSSYYKVEAVDSNLTQSLGDRASVANTGGIPGAPVAAAESVSTAFNTKVVINEFPDATDNGHGTLQASTVTITTAAAHGTTVVNTSNGAITYTPQTGFSGVDSFQYTISDSTGVTSAPATITVTVGSQVVGTPVAANLSYTAVQGVPLVIDDAPSATDSTGSIDPATVTITQAPSHGTATVNASNGAITYTATVGYSGPDSIQYTIADNLFAVSAPATITITVAPTGPVAADFSSTVVANSANTINVISASSDASGNIVPSGTTITTQPQHGSATVDSATGVIIYTPSAGYFGTDSLQYTLLDSNNAVSKVATLSLDVGVAINNTTARSLTYVDNLGNKVTVALTGGGTGEVFFNGTGSVQSVAGPHGTGTEVVTGAGLSISNITVTGSPMAGALTISRKGTASVLLGGIAVTGGIGRIIAPTSSLTGSLSVTGALTLLQLASASGASINIGSVGATRAGFSFTSGHIVNTSLVSATPVNAIRVTDWIASGMTDSIAAPSVTSLVTAGNLQASLTTTGGSPFSLNTVRVGGQVDAEGWNITGAANSVVVGSVASGWTGTFNQLVNAFTIRAGGFAGTLNAAGIGGLTITGDDTGTITAGSIRSARINGSLSGASITLTTPVTARGTSLGRLSVTGETANSTIVSAGSIGAITTAGITSSSVDAGTNTGVTLPTSSGDFTASATISSFSVVGRGSRFTASSIGAQLIGALNLGTIITGNGGHAFGVGAATINSLTGSLDIGGVLHMNKTTLASSAAVSAYIATHSLNLGDFEINAGV